VYKYARGWRAGWGERRCSLSAKAEKGIEVW